jgi:hypothetical protein
MDGQHFDDLTRRLAHHCSRRQALRGLSLGLVVVAVGRSLPQAAAQGDVECPTSLEAFRAELRARIASIRALPLDERSAAVKELRAWIREVRRTCDLVILPMRPST